MLDVITIVLSLALKLTGFPAQFRSGKTALPFAAGMLISYALWVAQGIYAGDWAVVISQSAGVVLSGALLVKGVNMTEQKPEKKPRSAKANRNAARRRRIQKESRRRNRK